MVNELMTKLQEDVQKLDIEPKYLLSVAHKKDNVLGIWWYSLETGEVRWSPSADVIHSDKHFKDVAYKPDWIKGRVFHYKSNVILLIYMDRSNRLTDSKLIDLIDKCEKFVDVKISYVIDHEGVDLSSMLDLMSEEVLHNFSIRKLNG